MSLKLVYSRGLGHIDSCLGSDAWTLFEARHLSEQHIWYVSYRSNITPRENGERRCARATRKFKAEAEARQFARQMIESGWSAIAGTLNPHTPKRTVASTQILDWIAGKD
jgi:hypothetical protein